MPEPSAGVAGLSGVIGPGVGGIMLSIDAAPCDPVWAGGAENCPVDPGAGVWGTA